MTCVGRGEWRVYQLLAGVYALTGLLMISKTVSKTLYLG